MASGGHNMKRTHETGREKERSTRIKREVTRMMKTFSDVSDDIKNLAEGLVKRAAFMRIALEDLEADIKERGYVEQFTQSAEVDPFDRKRPAVEIYNTTVKNYQVVMRQLADLLPKQSAALQDDGFDDFVNGRQ